MKNIKRFAAAALVAFFLFAPPGTLIFLGVIAAGALGIFFGGEREEPPRSPPTEIVAPSPVPTPEVARPEDRPAPAPTHAPAQRRRPQPRAAEHGG